MIGVFRREVADIEHRPQQFGFRPLNAYRRQGGAPGATVKLQPVPQFPKICSIIFARNLPPE
jgi:hypothetical protein